MTLRTSLLTPPDTVRQQLQKRSIREQGMIRASPFSEGERPRQSPRRHAYHNNKTLPPLRHNSEQQQQQRQTWTDNKTTGFFFHRNACRTPPLAPISQVLGRFWFVQVCVCLSVCARVLCVTGRMHGCVRVRLKFVCVCVCACMCAMPPLRLNTFVRLESADGVASARG